MPYRLSGFGERSLRAWHLDKNNSIIPTLTNWQKQVLVYLEGREGFTTSHEIGLDLKLHPRAVSGIAYSLYKRGLVDKKE